MPTCIREQYDQLLFVILIFLCLRSWHDGNVIIPSLCRDLLSLKQKMREIDVSTLQACRFEKEIGSNVLLRLSSFEKSQLYGFFCGSKNYLKALSELLRRWRQLQTSLRKEVKSRVSPLFKLSLKEWVVLQCSLVDPTFEFPNRQLNRLLSGQLVMITKARSSIIREQWLRASLISIDGMLIVHWRLLIIALEECEMQIDINSYRVLQTLVSVPDERLLLVQHSPN